CPGHGISVGSLGQFAGETDIVQNVWVENVVMANAQNGARIKVFGGNPSPPSTAGGGTGFFKNVTFTNFHVENVDNPILIDQCYMTAANVCAEFPSTLIISDVHYNHVFGTASKASKGVVVHLYK
ncbi:glycoside hydrolase family 28 protein, partial [Sphaerobolus stellatus SS14]